MSETQTETQTGPQPAVTQPERTTAGARMRGDWRRGISPQRAAIVVLVAVVGYFVPNAVRDAHGMTVLVNGLLLGIMALSVGFLLNLLGWVSFGASAFSGAAAYLFAVLCVSSHLDVLPAVLLAIVGATVGAFLIGMVFVRSKALVFTMLTLALGQLLLQVVSLDGLRTRTGGSDGMVVNYSGTLGGMTVDEVADPGLFWPLVWSVTVVAVLMVHWIGQGRLGRSLRGIRENEDRMRHSGFNTYLPKLLAFAFAGLLGSVAGVLQALNTGFVSPDLLSFGASGNAVIAVLIGGFETPLGPLVGGLLLVWGQDKFGSSGELYLYTGLAVIVVLTAFPRGLLGLVAKAWQWARTSARPASAAPVSDLGGTHAVD
ncbi:branched-chain amino acid ABC transporter permease [Streptomyces sp. NPDC002577]